MKKRSLAMILSVIMIATAFAGCGSSENASTTTKAENSDTDSAAKPLTVEFFQQKGEEGPQKGYQLIIDNFNNEYPNIKIEMNTVPDAGKVLTSRIASNDIPPIFTDFPTQLQFKQKVTNGFVEKLSGNQFLDRINPGAIEMSKATDGELYALPYSNNFYGVYYNKDIFAENNLSIPKTYDEFINICKTLKEKGITPLGITSKDPGQVGHMFQGMNVAWMANGFETISSVIDKKAKIEGNADYKVFAEKLTNLFTYANDDALGIANTSMWENFANGKYAMALTGSYARGTILIANPNLKMGIFPIPNDTYEKTNILSGIDAAVCISAKASAEEKAAGLKFLEFLSRTEQAQIFCDNDGAPSALKDVKYKDDGVQPIIDIIKAGQVHDWAASTIASNVTSDVYSVTQGFLVHKDVNKYLKELDSSIEISSAQ